jgi:D-glycero-alpha-D-manno-heptose-7-phosphate kinase
LAVYVAERLERVKLAEFAGLLKTAWELKSVIGGVANERLLWQYNTALSAGALGGKLLGAGGGGCWFFLVKGEARERVKNALGLVEIPFRIERLGTTDGYF